MDWSFLQLTGKIVLDRPIEDRTSPPSNRFLQVSSTLLDYFRRMSKMAGDLYERVESQCPLDDGWLAGISSLKMWVSWLVLEWCRLLRRRVSLIMQISTRPYVASLRFTAFRFLTISLISLYSGLRCVRYRAGSARPSITCHLSMFSWLCHHVWRFLDSASNRHAARHTQRPTESNIHFFRWTMEGGRRKQSGEGSRLECRSITQKSNGQRCKHWCNLANAILRWKLGGKRTEKVILHLFQPRHPPPKKIKKKRKNKKRGRQAMRAREN